MVKLEVPSALVDLLCFLNDKQPSKQTTIAQSTHSNARTSRDAITWRIRRKMAKMAIGNWGNWRQADEAALKKERSERDLRESNVPFRIVSLFWSLLENNTHVGINPVRLSAPQLTKQLAERDEREANVKLERASVVLVYPFA
jgi:hypothetical protein